MPSIIRKEEITFENCGTNYKKQHCTAQEEMFSWITYMPFLQQLFDKVRSGEILDNHKKLSKATARVVHKLRICDKDFHSLYLLREHKRKEHGAVRGSGAQNVDATQLMGDVDGNSLKKELETCKLFWWTVRWRMGDRESTTLHGYCGLKISVGKVRFCV